jgi:DNA-binding CsgD family transcriptional regulator
VDTDPEVAVPRTDADVASILAQVSSEPGRVATGPYVAVSAYFAGRRESAIAAASEYLDGESGFDHDLATLVMVLAACQRADPIAGHRWVAGMSTDNPYGSVLRLVCTGLIAEMEFDFARSADLLGQAMGEFVELGLVSMSAPLGSIRAIQLFRLGRWTEALIDLENATTVGGDDAVRLQLNSLRCSIEHLRGNTAAAEDAWHRAQRALAAGHIFGRTFFTSALAQFYSDTSHDRSAALLQHWAAQVRNGERIQALVIGPDIARLLRDTGDPACAAAIDQITEWATEAPGSALDDVAGWCRAIVDASGDQLEQLARRLQTGGASWLACQAWDDASVAHRHVGDARRATGCAEHSAVLSSAIGVTRPATNSGDAADLWPRGDGSTVISQLSRKPRHELSGPWAALSEYFSGDLQRAELIAAESIGSDSPFDHDVASLVMVLVSCQSHDLDAAWTWAYGLNDRDPHVALVRAACLGIIAEIEHDFCGAEQHFGDAIERARAHGITPVIAAFAAVRATQRFRLGDWDGALADLDTAIEHPNGDGFQLQVESIRCMILQRRGHTAEASEAWRRAHLAIMSGNTFGRTWYTLALVELATDDVSVAATAALEHWTEQIRRGERMHALSLAPSVARLARDRAQPSATDATDLVLDWSSSTASEALLFVSNWCRSIVEADPVQLEETATHLESGGALWLAYQAWLDVRSAHMARGGHAEAARGSDVLARLEQRIGIVEAKANPSPFDGLTPAERRVAARVGEGLRNDAIASELFLSRRTVESHLTAVFRKLSVTNRTELARMWLSTRENP